LIIFVINICSKLYSNQHHNLKSVWEENHVTLAQFARKSVGQMFLNVLLNLLLKIAVLT